MEGVSNNTSTLVFSPPLPGHENSPSSPEGHPPGTERYTPDACAQSAPSSTIENREVSVTAAVTPSLVTPACGKPPETTTEAFYTDCQSLVHRFLHAPQPGSRPGPGEIPRPVHGAMHQCRAALWVAVLLTLRRELGDPEALAFDRSQLPSVMKAALLHDSGREGEGADRPEWEQASGEHCEDHLLVTGCHPSLAAACKSGISHKDRTDRGQKSLIEKLIHDADCLEIMRVPEGNHFDISRLDIYRDLLPHNPQAADRILALAKDIRQVIADQGDLWGDTSILNFASPQQSPKLLATELAGTKDEKTKQAFEFAANAMQHQLAWLEQHAPGLFRSYCQSAGTPPAYSPLSPLSMTKTSAAMGYSAGTGFDGCYQDAAGKHYYIKEPQNPDAARNEVLMVRLAAALGLNVPTVHLAREQGRTFVVSEWQDGLKEGQRLLEQLPREELARIYLVASVLGNGDIAGYCWDNLVVNASGQAIALDWGEAGEYERYALHHKIETFGSTVFELDLLLDPTKNVTGRTFSYDQAVVMENAASLFSRLTRKDIETAASELLDQDLSSLPRLIESLGPDAPMDRQHLQRTIHDRLAYLARRYPPACQNRITAAEQAAITASGVSGYSLPVSSRDIDQGELRIYQCIDSQNQPVTECWLRLKPDAARALSDRLGLPYNFARELKQLHIYLLELEPQLTPVWRNHLQKMASLCQRIKTGVSSQSSLQNTSATLSLLEQLSKLEEGIKKQLALPDGSQITLNHLTLPTTVATGLPCRVSTCAFQQQEPALLPTRELRYTRAWETGQIALDNTYHYLVQSENLLPEKLANIEIDWFGDMQSDNLAFEGVLRLRIDGQDKTASGKLVDALSQLGIDSHRPLQNEVQEFYTDSLIRYFCLDQALGTSLPEDFSSWPLQQRLDWKSQWLCGQKGWSGVPGWEQNHRIYGGRCIFYCPETLVDFRETDYTLHHKFNFCKMLDARTVAQIAHSGGNLCSLSERIRMGTLRQETKTASKNSDFRSGGARSVFLTCAPASMRWSDSGVRLKQKALYRTDLTLYDTDLYGNLNSAVQAVSRYKPEKAQLDILSWKGKNEILAPSLSLEEVAEGLDIEACDLKSIQMTYWPDGHPFGAVFEDDLFKQFCKGKAASLVKAAGPRQLYKLRSLNPDLEQGIATSLKGIKLESIKLDSIILDQATVSGITFNNTDVTDAEIHSVHFANCQIKWSLKETIKLIRHSCDFHNCNFAGSLDSNTILLHPCTFTFDSKFVDTTGTVDKFYSALTRGLQIKSKKVAGNALLQLGRLLHHGLITDPGLKVQMHSLLVQVAETLTRDRFPDSSYPSAQLNKEIVDFAQHLAPNHKKLIKSMGAQFSHVLANNPDILQTGKLKNLEGIKIGSDMLPCITKETSLKGSVFENMTLEAEWLGDWLCELKGAEFINCKPAWLNERAMLSYFSDHCTRDENFLGLLSRFSIFGVSKRPCANPDLIKANAIAYIALREDRKYAIPLKAFLIEDLAKLPFTPEQLCFLILAAPENITGIVSIWQEQPEQAALLKTVFNKLTAGFHRLEPTRRSLVANILLRVLSKDADDPLNLQNKLTDALEFAEFEGTEGQFPKLIMALNTNHPLTPGQSGKALSKAQAMIATMQSNNNYFNFNQKDFDALKTALLKNLVPGE